MSGFEILFYLVKHCKILLDIYSIFNDEAFYFIYTLKKLGYWINTGSLHCNMQYDNILLQKIIYCNAIQLLHF